MSTHGRVFGQVVHIAGSIDASADVASLADVDSARDIVKALVVDLLAKGASFVVAIDAEKTRECDGRPICFDWLVLNTVWDNLGLRPAGGPKPAVVVIKHHKSEDQVPTEYLEKWNAIRSSDEVELQSAAHWNMASQRMQIQARSGDILVALGGSEGVLFLANQYHGAGKPVVPLNLKISKPDSGALRLYSWGAASNNAHKLFRSTGAVSATTWLNRLDASRKPTDQRVKDISDLLQALKRPEAFVVRLLNPKHADYMAVQWYFDHVVKPVVETEMGYSLTVVDGEQDFEFPRVDQEIFSKLHRSNIVVADLTGCRPNCFVELGYALGRGVHTMMCAKQGTELPFDLTTLGGHFWDNAADVSVEQERLRKHWQATRNRPPIVQQEPLIP